MTSGGLILFFLAASLTMASASSTLPRDSSQRGDSGMNLPQYTTERETDVESPQKRENNFTLFRVLGLLK